MSGDIAYPLFPIVAFLGFIVPLIPLTWHLQALNSGTCFFIMWSSLASLNQFVNSVVWHGNFLNPAPVWCEICKNQSYSYSPFYTKHDNCIAIRIIMGASVGIPAASLCINRRLYYIASSQSASITLAEVCQFFKRMKLC